MADTAGAWARVEAATTAAAMGVGVAAWRAESAFFTELKATVELVTTTLPDGPRTGSGGMLDAPTLGHIDHGPLDELQRELLAAEGAAYARIAADFPGEPFLALAARFGHAHMRALQRQLDSMVLTAPAVGSAAAAAAAADRRRRNLSPHATRVLSRWIQEHAQTPYPSEEEKVRGTGRGACLEARKLTQTCM
jgi:hypothetical protein